MLDIRRILVASDLSEGAALAETRAAKLCRRFDVPELEIVHVQDTGIVEMLGQLLGGSGRKSQDVITEQVVRDFEPRRKQLSETFGIKTSLTILFGRPSAEIAGYVNNSDVSLLVMGARQSDNDRNFFLGNTADRLLHVSDVPLLIVRQPPEKPYHDVLIPVDFSDNSNIAARVAMQLMLPAANKTFLHVFDVPNEGLMHYANVSSELIEDFRSAARNRAEECLGELLASLGSRNRVSGVVKFGNPDLVIERYIENRRPDLIVMGRQGRTHLANLLLGSTTRHIVNETRSDILIVPQTPELASAVAD